MKRSIEIGENVVFMILKVSLSSSDFNQMNSKIMIKLWHNL